MTVVAVLFFPVVLVYQGRSFHVFRAPVTAPPAPDAEQSPPSAPTTVATP